MTKERVVVLAFLLACDRGERSAPPQPSPTVASQAAPFDPAMPAEPAAVTDSATAGDTSVNASVASFNGDTLIACVDAAVSGEFWEKGLALTDAGPAALLADALHWFLVAGSDTMIGTVLNQGPKRPSGLLRPPGKPQDVSKPCSEQFAARHVLGRCSAVVDTVVVGPRGSNPARVALTISYYDLGESDGVMRRCIAAKGDWSETRR